MANHTEGHVRETILTENRPVPNFTDEFWVLGEKPGEPDFTNVKDAAIWERYLVFGQFAITEVLREVKDTAWQTVRLSMLGTTHEFKWNALKKYLEDNGYDRHSRCVVTNYVYALKRGGVIK